MNALELLKQDHQKVSGLFEQAEATENEQQKQRFFEQIASELQTHTHIEETIFYPALRERDELKDLVREAFEEHSQIKTLIREMDSFTSDAGTLVDMLMLLKEEVEHHVQEEENEMFLKVEQFFGAPELGQLGQRLQAAKQDLGKQKSTSSGSR